MRRKSKIQALLYSVVVLLALFSGGSQVFADGGQASTGGKITFYGGEVESSTSTSESTKDSTSSSTSTSGTVSGGKDIVSGKLPNTGEIIRNYSFIGVGVLLILIILFVYRRRKQRED